MILNEHLTKALRLLKRASPSSTVDKQVMTNILLQFLSFPREDTKRFEILNLISSLLEWNDEQRHKAGLARTSNVRRTNSSLMLSEFPLSPGKEVSRQPLCNADSRVCRSCGSTFYRRRRLRGKIRTGWRVPWVG